jgi:ABC-2 type transport system ATP-binding protein
LLEPISGITSVGVKNELFKIECSNDSSAAIARAIVESGARLNYLSRKEYGLDDIYYRYFEGGDSHE